MARRKRIQLEAETDPSPPLSGTDIVKFQLGQIVWKKLEPEVSGMVTGIIYRPTGVLYIVLFTDMTDETTCYEIEIMPEKSFK